MNGQQKNLSERAAESAVVDLHLIVQILRRRFWIFVAVVVASLLLGTLITLKTVPVYRAQAMVLIAQSAPEVLQGVREVYDLGADNFWTTKEYYQTQYIVIKSVPVVQKAAMQLGLSPKLLAEQLRAAPVESAEARTAADPLFGLAPALREKIELLGFTHKHSRQQVIEALSRLDVTKFIQDRLDVRPVKDSRLVTIAAEDSVARRAALIANAVADAYIDYNLEQKVVTTRSAVDWLSDQVNELRDRLRQSELQLYEFKKANHIISVSMEDRQTMVAETLSQLNGSLSQARAKRIEMESRRAGSAVAEGSLDGPSWADVQNNNLVQTLKSDLNKLRQEQSELAAKYTEEHPKLLAVNRKLGMLQEELDREVGKIVQGWEQEYRSAINTERRLEEALDGVKREALEINKKEIEYTRLKRERDNTKDLFDLVLKRQKEADLSQLLKVNNVRSLETARQPDKPIRPRPGLNLVLSLLFGVAAGVAVAFLIHHLDNTIKTQKQIEDVMRSPCLGIVPRIATEKVAKQWDISARDRFVIAKPRSSVAEAYRTIRTNLLFMAHERGAKRIVVTSSGPEDGKSMTVINLGIAMAQSGARTLLVETDLRRPRLYKSFALAAEHGVSQLIVGEADVAQCIYPSSIEGLDILPCGPIPPNPAELLHADSFKRLVDELTARYDRIFFDSPPVNLVADALVLGSMADGVVLVIRAGHTSIQAALHAKQQLVDVGANIFGVVLNGADAHAHRVTTYYGYHYYDHDVSDEEESG